MASRSARAEPAAGPPERNAAGPPDPAEERVLVGEVIRPHGLCGEVKVAIHSDVPERFETGAELWLTVPRQAPRRVRVAGLRPGTGGALLLLEGCETREQAETLRRGRLEVDVSEVPEAPEGTYYHHQLIGCGCVDEALGQLGEVVAVLEDGGGELLEIERPGGRRVLVPFVESLVVEIDLAGRRIGLRLPPGLLEACETG